MTALNPDIQATIQCDFTPEDQAAVEQELLSIELKHVMAESQWNLDNTLSAILYLAKGDVNQVIELTAFAKIDFRDVFYWASMEKKKATTKKTK